MGCRLRVEDVDFLRRVLQIEWQVTQGSNGERSERRLPDRGGPSRCHGWSPACSLPPGKGAPLEHVHHGHKLIGRAVADVGSPKGTTGHDLRHHYASVLLAAGESVVAVAERLGHEDASPVLSTYGHLMPDSDDRTRRAVDAAWDAASASCTPVALHGAKSVR